jgi:hypothetical protein
MLWKGFFSGGRRDQCARPMSSLIGICLTFTFIVFTSTPASAGDVIGQPYPGGGGGSGGGSGGSGGGNGGGGGGNQPPQHALVTIDRQNDNLLSINPSTGELSVIGPIGHDMISPHLTFMNGRLFALNMNTINHTEIVELDLLTGAAISAFDVRLNSQVVSFAEGLANDGDELLIGFRTGASLQHSNAMGRLALDGTVSGVVNLASLNSLADIDGFKVNPATGTLISTDTRANDNTISFYNVDDVPADYDLLSQFTRDSAMQSINDLDFLNGYMVGLDDVTRRLHWIDPINGQLLHSVNLTGSSELRGLAAVPTPGTLLPLAAGILFRRSRRRIA